MNHEAVAPAEPTLGVTERSTSYLRHLLFFTFVATLFEGYDVLIINLALPYLGRDFQADSQTLGFAMSLISVGTIAAFVPVRLADRHGRRPVFLWVAAGYTVFTVLTAFSVGLYDFVVYQWLGSVGKAAAVLAALNFLCVPVILRLLVETKGKPSEESA